MKRFVSAAVRHLMRRSLRGAFRRVCWIGPMPQPDPDRPVIVYSNHHNFYDGFLGSILADAVFFREPILWMQEWDRFPLFGAVGAYPFPADDPARRARTLRRSIRRLQRPGQMLIYYPEGVLHNPDEGIFPFDASVFRRLDRVLPPHTWWPVACHVTWWNDDRPTALLSAGPSHHVATGDEWDRLERAWTALHRTPTGAGTVLLESRRPSADTRSLSVLRPLFERYL